MGRTVAAVLLAALATAPAGAQTPWERYVQDRLRVIAADVAPQGWRLAPESFTGQLREGERETLRVSLREGGHYALVALCNADCRDLELTVLGEDDAVLARSGDGTGTPLIELRPPARGKYRVVVTMAHCATESCAYGVGILTR